MNNARYLFPFLSRLIYFCAEKLGELNPNLGGQKSLEDAEQYTQKLKYDYAGELKSHQDWLKLQKQFTNEGPHSDSTVLEVARKLKSR